MCFMNEQPYLCRTKACFWLQEMRLAVNAVVNDGIDVQKLRELSDSENFFSAASKARAKEIAQSIIRRMTVVEDRFFPYFLSSSIEEQKLLNMVMIMLEDRTVYEFMNEVYKEKLIKGESVITDAEILGFIHDIQGRDSKAAKWTDPSMKKCRSCIKGFLSDGGLATHEYRQMSIERPILTQSLIDFLRSEDYAEIANIFAGER